MIRRARNPLGRPAGDGVVYEAEGLASVLELGLRLPLPVALAAQTAEDAGWLVIAGVADTYGDHSHLSFLLWARWEQRGLPPKSALRPVIATLRAAGFERMYGQYAFLYFEYLAGGAARALFDRLPRAARRPNPLGPPTPWGTIESAEGTASAIELGVPLSLAQVVALEHAEAAGWSVRAHWSEFPLPAGEWVVFVECGRRARRSSDEVAMHQLEATGFARRSWSFATLRIPGTTDSRGRLPRAPR
jgi:hypothetical protein